MSPRADFVCNSKKCETPEGAASVYELPVDATHCPRGHKRLKRLFNKVGVIGTRAVSPEPDWRLTRADHSRTDTIQRDAYDQHRATRVQSPDIVSLPVGHAEREVNLPGGRKFVQPSREQAAQLLGVGGQGRLMTSAEIAKAARHEPWSPAAIFSRQEHRRTLENHTEYYDPTRRR